MKVRMKVSLSGTRDGQEWPKIGGTIDLPDAEAKEYVASGLAALPGSDAEAAVTDDSDVETATVETKPKRRGRPPKPESGLSRSSMQGDE